jgi:NAD(P)-dependent dehydrogenase (short-subunit alcohol dehydrogenase family)
VERGEKVVAELSGEFPASDITFQQMDLASLASVKRFCDRFRARYTRLDLLILNAGFAHDFMSKEIHYTADGFEDTVGCNHVAHMFLTLQLIGLLKAARMSRVVSLASEAHRTGKLDLSDLQLLKKGAYSAMAAYGNSKLMNIAFAMELNKRYMVDGITANSVHPGSIPATNFFTEQGGFIMCMLNCLVPACSCCTGGLQTLDEGAEAVMHAAFSPVSGIYFNVQARATPAGLKDPTLPAQLWEETLRLIEGAGNGEVERPIPAAIIGTQTHVVSPHAHAHTHAYTPIDTHADGKHSDTLE